MSSLLCSIFLADLESTHLQDLLPQASWHPSARVQPHLHPSQPSSAFHPTSSSAAHLTDLAQAADRNEQPVSEMRLGTSPSRRGAQDIEAASQAGIGPAPAQQGYSTARERLPQADSFPDEHMDEANGEQWLTQPSQTDAESSRHICSNGSGLHASSSEVCKEGEAWYTQSASQAAGTGSVIPLLDTNPACCNDGVADQQPDCQQLKKQRLTQMPAAVYPPADNAVFELEAHQPPASSTEGASAPCQSLGLKGKVDQRDSQTAKRGLVAAAAGVAGKGSDRRAPRLQSLLMRLIDDFLFITPSRTAAEALVNKLLKGKLLFLTQTNHIVMQIQDQGWTNCVQTQDHVHSAQTMCRSLPVAPMFDRLLTTKALSTMSITEECPAFAQVNAHPAHMHRCFPAGSKTSTYLARCFTSDHELRCRFCRLWSQCEPLENSPQL